MFNTLTRFALRSALLSSAALLTSVVGQSAQAEGEPMSMARAAELTCHRIDRLVTLKKIDAGYLNSFYGIEVQRDGAGYKVTAFQQSDAGKAAHKLIVPLDETGKPTGFTVVAGDTAAHPTAWPDIDPVTLVENALHFIEDNAAKADVTKFNSGLTALRLAPGKFQGKDVARVEVASSETSAKLIVYIGVDGALVGSELGK